MEEKIGWRPTASARPSAVPKLTEAERMRQSPFDSVVYDMAHSERIVNDLMLGRRVGFYELRGEIGQGNFSTVRLGIHALTKGQESQVVDVFFFFFLMTPPEIHFISRLMCHNTPVCLNILSTVCPYFEPSPCLILSKSFADI